MDISKCCNTKCPRREECFRYRVKPGVRQAYADFRPYDTDGNKCSGFSTIEGWADCMLIPVGAVVKNIFEAKEVASE